MLRNWYTWIKKIDVLVQKTNAWIISSFHVFEEQKSQFVAKDLYTGVYHVLRKLNVKEFQDLRIKVVSIHCWVCPLHVYHWSNFSFKILINYTWYMQVNHLPLDTNTSKDNTQWLENDIMNDPSSHRELIF